MQGVRRAASNPAWRFVALFALLLGLLSWLYPLATKRWFAAVEALNGATAWAVLVAAAPFGETARDGNLVRLGSFSVRVIEECTGVFEAILYAAAVLAYPTGPGRKAVGLALGIPLLYLFNLLRILALLFVGDRWPAHFEFMHVYFWQATLILMITSVWLLWIFKVVRHGARPAAPARSPRC
jgi:archaeosortase B (VPXXXP-CTERM-specific)